MYLAEALRVTEIKQLDTMSSNALENLQRVFTYCVQHKNWTFCSLFCTEKPYLMTQMLVSLRSRRADGGTRMRRPLSRGMRRQLSLDSISICKPGLLRQQPPQEQHGGGGGDGDAEAPGRNWFEFAPFMYELCLGFYHV